MISLSASWPAISTISISTLLPFSVFAISPEMVMKENVLGKTYNEHFVLNYGIQVKYDLFQVSKYKKIYGSTFTKFHFI